MSCFVAIALLLAFAILTSQAMGGEEALLAPTPSPSFLVDVPKFSWDLDRIGNAEISLDDSSEVRLHYNISIRDTKIQAFQGDCRTPIPSTVATLSSESVITSSSHANFTLVMDVVKENITAYPEVWTDDGVISMCLRVDLLLPSSQTSVTFHEQKLFITVGLLQDFSITGVSVDREKPSEETGSVDLGLNITAFQCNQDGDPSDAALSQGSDVYLCVETVSPGVEIADIRELTMSQGAFNTAPIVDSVPDPLTNVSITGKEASIRYQIVSDFFDDADPQDIVASGSVLLAFVDNGEGGRRRYLRNVKLGGHRILDKQETEEGFNVRILVKAAYSDESSSSAFTRTCETPLSLVALMVGGCVLVF